MEQSFDVLVPDSQALSDLQQCCSFQLSWLFKGLTLSLLSCIQAQCRLPSVSRYGQTLIYSEPCCHESTET
ncbi:hypothetical protein Mapa_008404 [Marchantia paleacea]|nr:hypothetical protein Mapa_008404 [Marchantia paleacea]